MKFFHIVINFIVLFVAAFFTFIGWDSFLVVVKKGNLNLDDVHVLFVYIALPIAIIFGAILVLANGFKRKWDSLEIPLAMFLFIQAWGFHAYSAVSLVFGFLTLLICFLSIRKNIKGIILVKDDI